MRYNRKTVSIITAPASSPVSLADMKAYLRVDTSSDDTLIQDFIDAAAETVKQYIRKSLITETLELTMDGFSSNTIDERLDRLGPGVHTASYPYFIGYSNEVDLPFPPIQSITSVTTFNRSNTSAVYSSDNYQLDETGGRIYLNEGQTWPDNLRDREAVKIRYVAGYGDADDIPKPIVQVIKQLVGKYYDCREMCEMPDICKQALAPYRLIDTMGY